MNYNSSRKQLNTGSNSTNFASKRHIGFIPSNCTLSNNSICPRRTGYVCGNETLSNLSETTNTCISCPHYIYGGLYSNFPQMLTLPANTPSKIILPLNMPSANIACLPANTLSILHSGDYMLSFYLSLSVSNAANISFSIQKNGIDIPSTIITKALSSGGNATFNENVISSFSVGDIIDMTISSSSITSITLGSGTNASLTLQKLN